MQTQFLRAKHKKESSASLVSGDSTVNRDLLLDFSKGYLISLVVLGHSIQAVQADFAQSSLFSFIYSFHMPLFFTLSGFGYWLVCSSSAPRKSVKKNLSRKFASLYRPFVVWSTFLFILTPEKRSAGLGIFEYFSDPFSAYWFLDILFYLFFVVLLVQGFINAGSHSRVRIAGIFSIAFAADFALCKLFGFEFRSYHVLYYLPYFFLGIAAYKLRSCATEFLIINESRIRKIAFLALSAGLLLLVTSMWEYPGSVKLWTLQIADLSSPLVRNLLEYSVRCLCVLSAFGFGSMLFAVLPGFFRKVFVFLGVSSLEIYLLHGFFLTPALNVSGSYFTVAALVLSSSLAFTAILRSVSRKTAFFEGIYMFCFGRKVH